MLQKTKVSISGTHCASCHTIIREEWKKKGINNVKLSASGKTLNATIESDQKISIEELQAPLTEHGYKVRTFNDTPLPSWKSYLIRTGKILLLVAVIYFILDKIGILSYQVQAAQPKNLWAVFGVGLIASFSSCAAVVGGLVLATSAAHAKRHPNDSIKNRITPHLLFNTGRVLGFAGFGALLGLIGTGIRLSPTSNGLFVLFVALLMISLGANLLSLWPKGRLPLELPHQITDKIHALKESEHPLASFFLGAMTFFLPCGFTQSMQLVALATGSPIESAAIMAIFAIGTIPALLSIGFASSLTRGKTLASLSAFSGILVMILGISQLTNAATLLDLRLPTIQSTTTSSVSSKAPTIIGNEQVIEMAVTSAGVYEPDVLEVVEGIPVLWKINGAKFMGCGNSLILRTFGVSATLVPGANEVRFTPTKSGKFTFSCSMGMIRGTMIVNPAQK